MYINAGSENISTRDCTTQKNENKKVLKITGLFLCYIKKSTTVNIGLITLKCNALNHNNIRIILISVTNTFVNKSKYGNKLRYSLKKKEF